MNGWYGFIPGVPSDLSQSFEKPGWWFGVVLVGQRNRTVHDEVDLGHISMPQLS
jgi:hypothetical protein